MASLRPARSLVAGVAALAFFSAAEGFAQDRSVLLSGGGSTFAAPIFKAWIESYRSIAPDIDISYEVIGSGEGVARFLAGSLDFAATDAPLTEAQEAEVPGGIVHVPVTAGMIAVAYNLPGDVEGELRLPRTVLGDIFAGNVTAWDDPRLMAANPGLNLPHQAIQIIARQDGSGTTYAFTNHLDAISESWRATGRGVSTLVAWPNKAMKARGNEGVAVTIQRSEGSIGYVEYGVARQARLALAAIENASGVFVSPSAKSGAAAIAAADLRDDLKIEMRDPAGAEAYPIVTFSWELLRSKPQDTAKDTAVRAFTRWTVTDGQNLAEGLGYVPMPQIVRDRAAATLGAGL